MSKQKVKDRKKSKPDSSSRDRGNSIIQTRLLAMQAFVEGKGIMPKIFDHHIHPLIEKGKIANLITPEAIPEELTKGALERDNLLIVDLILLHCFSDQGNIPYELLTDPVTGKYDGEYIARFLNVHGKFCELWKLDTSEDFDGEAYRTLLSRGYGERPSLAILPHILDLSSLIDDNIMGLMKGDTEKCEMTIPSNEEWERIAPNIANAILKFHAGMGDVLGYAPLVRDMKDFAVRILYPDLWEYVEYEIGRFSKQIQKSHEIMLEIQKMLKGEIKRAGIEATVGIRERGKSLGSLCLKAMGRYDELMFANKSTIVELPIRKENIKRKIPELVKRHVPEDSQFIYPHIESDSLNIHDISAGWIIVKSYKGNTEEKKLGEAMYRISEEILPRCVRRVLSSHGIVSRRNETTDYAANPKPNKYRSVHFDTVDMGREISFAAFEWIVRTNEMHEFAERGGAAHMIYKESSEEAAEVADIYQRFMNRLAGTKKDEKINVREIKSHELKIHFGREGKTVPALEGTYLIDALADAGINLSGIGLITDKKTGERVSLKLKIENPVEITLRKARSYKDQLIQRATAQALIRDRNSYNQKTMEQLRDIASANRKKNGNHN